MCGILGFFSNNKFLNQTGFDERITAALSALKHRGPDAQGAVTIPIKNGADVPINNLYLGHTRLSIIDLSDGGHQPMNSKDGRYCLVFNGEIYNYKELKQELLDAEYVFKSDSDTEVLISAWQHWGVSAIKRLVGMFAFAIYDRIDCTLTLVRDAFGIKPLFYCFTSDSFSFASEISAIKTLIGDELKPDWQQSYVYLTEGEYDYGEKTFFHNVKQLLPGHLTRYNLKTCVLETSERWWWPSIKERKDLSFDDAANKLRDIFLKNVKLHLRSDVPVGAALSGGLDSSAVVCAMRHIDPHIKINTFTYVDRGSAIDEEKWADIVNKHTGAVPVKVLVDSSELGRDIDDLIDTQGEPFGGTSIYAQYRVFNAARKAGVVVTLDGQGADELLAGYNGYPHAYILSLYEKRQYLKIISFLRKWVKWPGRSYLQAFRLIASLTIPSSILRLLLTILNKNPPFPKWLNKRFVIVNKLELNLKRGFSKTEEGKGRRLVEQLRNAMTGGGLSPLLRHGDRDSMRWSVESRVPFLTTELAEFVLSLPESFLLSEDGQTKYIFREAMRGIVPDEILDRRDKIGFETPEHEWLVNQKDIINNWIASVRISLINEDEAIDEINKILTKNKKFGRHVWRLINYSRWYNINFKNV